MSSLKKVIPLINNNSLIIYTPKTFFLQSLNINIHRSHKPKIERLNNYQSNALIIMGKT